MTKLVLDTIKKKKVANGVPFKNMINDHTPQKKIVQSKLKTNHELCQGRKL
jgi:hypothetical protein